MYLIVSIPYAFVRGIGTMRGIGYLTLRLCSQTRLPIPLDLSCNNSPIDLLAILEKSLDRALIFYIFIHKVRLSGIRASISIVHIRKFYKN